MAIRTVRLEGFAISFRKDLHTNDLVAAAFQARHFSADNN